MKTSNVILFQSRERLQQKARAYIEDPPRFLEERGQAVPLLLQALKLGDPDLKREIMLLLGGFAGPDVIWPLFRLLTDPNEDEEVRHDAAVQLSVTASFLNSPQELIDQLVAALKSTDPVTRAAAAFALGWRGNGAAAIALIDCLYDPDPQVQQAAVNALSNLEDDRVLGLLIDRLHHAALEQRRGILYNLWRFAGQRRVVAEEYRCVLACPTDELRTDALILLGMIGGIEHRGPAFRNLFKDPDARIRELAFKELAGLPPPELMAFKNDIQTGLADPEPRVKRAALKIFKKIPPAEV
ncbi:MAG: HEAT repeat domain-containing protein [Desulfobacterales bacterium]